MGVCNGQPLAKSKDVHREVESEGSRQQSADLRDTNFFKHRGDKPAKQVKFQRLHGHRSVNETGTWSEGGLPYHGRPDGRMDRE